MVILKFQRVVIMKRTELESKLESLLFFVGDMILSNKLCELCEADEHDVHSAIFNLNSAYEYDDSGIRIVEVEKGYQMCTVPKNTEVILKYKQRPAKKLLTQTLLETLAIIAYSQPITKPQIEDIRGVRSEHAVSKLLEYNLIEEAGRLNVVGRPVLFGTTAEFLRHFGFTNLMQLPILKEELIEILRKEVQKEVNYIAER